MLFHTLEVQNFLGPINELIKEAKDLASNGAKEITLLGQNVNAYNYNEKKLSTLISEISEIKDIKRIRYSTSHPKDFTEDLIEAHRSNNKKADAINSFTSSEWIE